MSNGRPPRERFIPGNRYGISFRVDAKVKAAILRLSRETGRTQAQICEQLITQSLHDRWIIKRLEQLLAGRGARQTLTLP